MTRFAKTTVIPQQYVITLLGQKFGKRNIKAGFNCRAGVEKYGCFGACGSKLVVLMAI